MNDWEKLETSAEDLATEPVFTAEEVEEIVQRRARTRRSKLAAPLGFVLILLATIGLFTLVDLTIDGIRSLNKTDELAEKAFDFLEPVLVQAPASLESVKDNERDDLLLSAIWQVLDDERIRQLQEHTTDGQYLLDENGRYILPIEDVNAAYATLFGEKAEPYHHTIGSPDAPALLTEYDGEAGCYYVPTSMAASLYYNILIDADKNGDTLSLVIGFVPTMDVAYDDNGEIIEPEADAAVYQQVFTVTIINKDTGEFALKSITDQ